MKKYFVKAINSNTNEVLVSFQNIQAKDNLEALRKAAAMLEDTIFESHVHNYQVEEMR